MDQVSLVLPGILSQLTARFDFPGRGDKYSKMKWVGRKKTIASDLQNYNHFTGVDYDAKTETTAIFKVGLSARHD